MVEEESKSMSHHLLPPGAHFYQELELRLKPVTTVWDVAVLTTKPNSFCKNLYKLINWLNPKVVYGHRLEVLSPTYQHHPNPKLHHLQSGNHDNHAAQPHPIPFPIPTAYSVHRIQKKKTLLNGTFLPILWFLKTSVDFHGSQIKNCTLGKSPCWPTGLSRPLLPSAAWQK